MKRTSIIFILTLLFTSYIYGQDHVRFLNYLNDNPKKVVLKFNKITKHDPYEWKFEYVFDYDGKILFQRNIYKRKVMSDQYFEYNEKGDKIYERIDFFNENDSSQVLNTINEYNAQNRIIIQTITTEQGEILSIQDSVIYECNNMVCYRMNYLNTGKKYTYNLTYDCYNILESTIMYVMNGGYTNVHYKYYPTGEVSESQINNLVILKDEKIPINHVKEYFYTFDKHGNWTKRYVRIDYGKKKLELKRKITYRKNKS